jgi:hypothetical protein
MYTDGCDLLPMAVVLAGVGLPSWKPGEDNDLHDTTRSGLLG